MNFNLIFKIQQNQATSQVKESGPEIVIKYRLENLYITANVFAKNSQFVTALALNLVLQRHRVDFKKCVLK